MSRLREGDRFAGGGSLGEWILFLKKSISKWTVILFSKKVYQKTISKWIGAPPAKWHRSNMSYSLFRFLPNRLLEG
jgi:hypothetical protein